MLEQVLLQEAFQDLQVLYYPTEIRASDLLLS